MAVKTERERDSQPEHWNSNQHSVISNQPSRPTQPSIPPASINEYQLYLGRQEKVWLIPIADERVGVQVKL